MKKLLPVVTASLLLISCAKHTNEIQAQYVSPIEYRDYSCSQIGQEMARVSRRVGEVGGHVDKTASDDSAQMTVGLILLWPTLFFLDGDTPQAAEYARLKGQFEALETAAIQKNCNIKVTPLPVTQPSVNRKVEKSGDFSNLNN